MAFAVFIHRSDSIYDDSPAEQYQFPTQYLSRVEHCVGDWIIYLEPRRVPLSRGYFAIARVSQVIPDPKAQGMFLALIEPGTYLDFVNKVPFNDGSGPIERGLVNEHGKLSGRAQSAVRSISSEDFYRIIDVGLNERDFLLPREQDTLQPTGFAEMAAAFEVEEPRRRLVQISNRAYRDRLFRRVVLDAYDERCAISGLKLINGGGRAEVEAAHIKSVEANGPDSINNGIALSGTAHWMFDRGLISLSDDLEILVSKHVNDVDALRSFITRDARAIPPQRKTDMPHPHFLKWHREHCFKQ